MRIMVFDVPAVNGGALTVLEYFYNKFKAEAGNQYIFVVSKPMLRDTENITVLRYPWVKRSWLHRLYFDHFVAPGLVRKYQADEILSLQNLVIPHTRIKQTIYIQNSLPFTEYRIGFFQNALVWFYQNIYKWILVRSMRRASRIIVQTEWMKEACNKAVDMQEGKVEVSRITLNYDKRRQYAPQSCGVPTFFYPTNDIVTKNHSILIQACLALKQESIENYRVVLTLSGKENRRIRKLYSIVKKHRLPVEFVGYIPRETVLEYYLTSILIYPSYVETFGLPLAEAKQFNTPILASDCSFAREVLNDYRNVRYFNPFNVAELSGKMKDILLEHSR